MSPDGKWLAYLRFQTSPDGSAFTPDLRVTADPTQEAENAIIVDTFRRAGVAATSYIIPAAQQNVKAALAAYTTGKIPFLSLLETERNLVELRDRSYETSAAVYRRRATLERVVGGPDVLPQ